MTWFRTLGMTSRDPSIVLISQICLIMAVVTFLSAQLFAHHASSWSSVRILTGGILFSAILCLISQALFSSVMRLSYESLFCLVVIGAFLTSNELLRPSVSGITTSSTEYEELIGFLKFMIPLCLGIPILVGGAGFITSFYQNEHEMIRLQLYRHIAMAVYFEIGATVFVIFPVLRRILMIRAQ